MARKHDQSWNENRLVTAMKRMTAIMKRGGPFQPALANTLIEEAARNAARRKPPESGLSVPAVPPRGPLPKQGGAAAPLDFGTD